MECPSKDCRERVDGHQKTLYGKDGRGGLVACVKKNIPKSWLWTFVSSFGIILVIGSYSLLSRVQAGELLHDQNEQHIARNAKQIEKLEEISDKNEVRQGKIDENLKHIVKTLDSLAKKNGIQ